MASYLNPNSGEQEKQLTATLCALLLSNAIAQKLSEIVSVSSFLSNVGVSQILWVWMLDGALLILVTGLQSLLIDKYSRLKIIQSVVLGLAFSFVVLQILFWANAPLWLTQSLLYLVSQQQWMTFPLIFWIFTNDLLSLSQTKRLMPRIASFGFLGSFIGIGIAALSSLLFRFFSVPEEWVITFNTVTNISIYLAIYACLKFQISKYRVRQVTYTVEPLYQSVIEGWKFICGVELFRYLSISVLCIVICETIIEFRFLLISSDLFDNQYAYQSFYSIYLSARAMLESCTSTFLTKAVIGHLGLKAVFIIQPLFSCLAAIVMLSTSSFIGSIAGVFLQKNPQYSLDEPARKALQGLVPEERRGRVSIFVDSYLIGAGGILGSAVVLGILGISARLNRGSSLGDLTSPYYLWVAFFCACIACLLALRMRKAYDNSMLNWRLKRRSRNSNVLDMLDR